MGKVLAYKEILIKEAGRNIKIDKNDKKYYQT